MRRLLALAAVPALITLAACSSASTPAASDPAATPVPAVTSAAPAATLGTLALGAFPPTTDGKLAKGICQAWAGLRGQYAANAYNDSPVQLNQWFSGTAWQPVLSDAGKLGNDPAFTGLEAALGVATVGDTASIASAGSLDKACEAG